MAQQTVKVALDWTPNINHAGFLVAMARGDFEKEGLRVELLSPHVDDYKTTPAQKVVSGDADLAICPSETVVSYACQAAKSDKPKLKAVAAVLAKDTSAIVTLADSGIDRPAQLDGKKYASYGARYEGRIVQQMIRNDGGSGDFDEDASTGMLKLWDCVLKGEAAATWVFLGWEGVIAKRKGVKLNTFKLDDYKISYGYSPVMVTKESSLADKSDVIKKFLKASANGWKYVVESPEDAAKQATSVIKSQFSNLPEDVEEAVMVDAAREIKDNIMESSKPWGYMHESRWSVFLDWLASSGLLTDKMQSRSEGEGKTSLKGLLSGDVGDSIARDDVPATSLFTNDLLPL